MSYVWSIAISADGEYTAAGSNYPDNKVYLFDAVEDDPPVAYSISFYGASVSINVRPGASGVGCTAILISNEGTANIDVDISISGGGVTISPGAIAVTLAAGVDITVPICAIAATRSNPAQLQVTALARGYEQNNPQEQVNKSAGFTAIIEQFARLSISAEQPYSEFCRDSILNTSFTVINDGNWVDTIRFEVLNQKDLENAGFTVALSQPLIELDSQGEMTVPITVRAGNATEIVEEGLYTLIVWVATTLAGETAASSVTATLDIEECEEIAEGGGGGSDDDSGFLPAPSLAAAVAAVAVIALFRRPRNT